jgi:SAM-dependent methyltransferase
MTQHASGLHRAEVELKLLSEVRARTGGSLEVLDVGAGDGWLASRVRERLQPARVLVSDLSLAACKVAASRGLPAVVTSTDRGCLPFADRSFDLVIMSEVIEHVVDTDAAIDEASRVLRPGGHLVVSTPNLAAWFNRALLLLGVQPVFSEVSRRKVYGRPGSEVAGHLQLFTLGALRGFVADHGFTIERVRGAGYHDVPRLFRPFDRAVARWPSAAAILLVLARRPG